MAKGRTIAATEIIEKDRKALNLCQQITTTLYKLIPGDKQNEFLKEYGRIHFSRDGGLGRAAGKLQRDALCTRGRTEKAPYSNRNLRWHPLIVATETPSYAREVESIALDNRTLVFIIDGETWYPEQVHELDSIYCTPLDKWYEHRQELSRWSDEDWTRNSCVIPAREFSPWEYSIETLACLAIAVIANWYSVDTLQAYRAVNAVFDDNNYNPTSEYPSETQVDHLKVCPLCLAQLNVPPANLFLPEKPSAFESPWRPSKREEGREESLQLFHVQPLQEKTLYHTPRFVRYGHRWCNVATADHSIEETLDFMEAVIEAHQRKRAQKRL